MNAIPEIAVTLSGALLAHLRGLASELDVPLHWLVAGLVCDTVEGPPTERGAAPSRRAPGALCVALHRTGPYRPTPANPRRPEE